MRFQRKALIALIAVVAALGLVVAEEPQTKPAENEQAAPGGEEKGMEGKEPDHIRVQHILIGFEGSARPTKARRSAAEAKTLANEVLERAKKGEDFDALVTQYTDDSPPGIYAMANHEVQLNPPPPREFPRGRMVAAFGDVGFKLAVGEIGMSDYDPGKSPYGYHIIKRLE